MLRKIEGKRRKGMREDEMVGWHHQLNGNEFEQTLGNSEEQVGLPRIYNGLKTISLTSGAGKSAHPLVKE